MLYECRDIGGFLGVTLLWIHPIHQHLCRTQWPRVGNNIGCRDNRFVYGYVTSPFKVGAMIASFCSLHQEQNNLKLSHLIEVARAPWTIESQRKRFCDFVFPFLFIGRPINHGAFSFAAIIFQMGPNFKSNKLTQKSSPWFRFYEC